MGFFDKLLGRNQSTESNKNAQGNNLEGANVPFKIFQKFQEDTREGIQSLREKFTELVEENHGLRKRLISIGDRLDKIQRAQLQQGIETKKGLEDVNKSIVEMGGKVKPLIKSPDSLSEIPTNQQEKINAAKNELIKSINSTGDMRMFDRPSGQGSSPFEGSKRKPG